MQNINEVERRNYQQHKSYINPLKNYINGKRTIKIIQKVKQKVLKIIFIFFFLSLSHTTVMISTQTHKHAHNNP